MLPNYQIKENEKHFIYTFSITKRYIWKDKSHIYTKQENGKMKAETIESYIDLAYIVSKVFMDKYIELNSNFDRQKVNNFIYKKELPKNKKNKKGKKNKNVSK